MNKSGAVLSMPKDSEMQGVSNWRRVFASLKSNQRQPKFILNVNPELQWPGQSEANVSVLPL
jgi:hypothetical protein